VETIHCKTYGIFFNNWEALSDLFQKGVYSRILVIVDENTELHCLPIFREKMPFPFETIVIPEGEAYKNLMTAQFIWDGMIQAGADRHSLCINLGGGVIGDMGGWTAASFMRGMDFIQVPTTLLSMVDASVGGKLAIDFKGLKNLIGLIKDPNAVFIFPEFLNTLSPRELKSGMAEVLKHGLIQDKGYWEKVRKYKSGKAIPWDEWIYESVLIKKAVTEIDPMERGLRKILNYGHTLGHAIESHSLEHDDDPLTHGEAIAIGMICEAFISARKGYLSDSDLHQVTSGILAVFGKGKKELPAFKYLKNSLLKDKKNKGGSVMYSLLEKIGVACYNQEVNEADVIASLDYYNALDFNPNS
jgi:3-dehydroquinate synthase